LTHFGGDEEACPALRGVFRAAATSPSLSLRTLEALQPVCKPQGPFFYKQASGFFSGGTNRTLDGRKWRQFTKRLPSGWSKKKQLLRYVPGQCAIITHWKKAARSGRRRGFHLRQNHRPYHLGPAAGFIYLPLGL